jgi:hypothetical protein
MVKNTACYASAPITVQTGHRDPGVKRGLTIRYSLPYACKIAHQNNIAEHTVIH